MIGDHIDLAMDRGYSLRLVCDRVGDRVILVANSGLTWVSNQPIRMQMWSGICIEEIG